MYEDYNLDRSKCSCVFIEYSITRPKIMEEYNLCRSSMMNRLYHINPIRARHTLMIMALPLRNHTILPLRSNTVPLLAVCQSTRRRHDAQEVACARELLSR